jgi:hypothetical protein
MDTLAEVKFRSPSTGRMQFGIHPRCLMWPVGPQLSTKGTGLPVPSRVERMRPLAPEIRICFGSEKSVPQTLKPSGSYESYRTAKPVPFVESCGSTGLVSRA